VSAPDEEAALRAESSQIEQLLDELRTLVTAPAWLRVEDLLRRVVRLYGAGLGRTLDHARAAGADEPRLAELCSGDDLLASLLVLHGLHPHTTEQRIDRALALLRRELGLPGDALVVDSLVGGALRLRASGELGGGAMATRVAEGVVRRVIENVAPEVSSIEIVGLPVPRDPTLVQLRTPGHPR